MEQDDFSKLYYEVLIEEETKIIEELLEAKSKSDEQFDALCRKIVDEKVKRHEEERQKLVEERRKLAEERQKYEEARKRYDEERQKYEEAREKCDEKRQLYEKEKKEFIKTKEAYSRIIQYKMGNIPIEELKYGDLDMLQANRYAQVVNGKIHGRMPDDIAIQYDVKNMYICDVCELLDTLEGKKTR